MKTTLSTLGIVALIASVGSAGTVYDNGSANFTSLDIVAPTGSTVYDNGDADFVGGNEMTQWLQAEDFTLGSANTIDGATFSLLNTLVGGGNSNWDGNLHWFIFDSAGGVPGDLVDSGSAQNISINFVGTFTWDFYDVAFDFGQSVNLDAGDYFFGLHMANDYDNRDELYWGSTAANGTSTGWESDGGTQDNWSTNSVEHAFTLVPTPGTLAILSVGGLAAVRRRR